MFKTKAARAAFVDQRLAELYPEPPIPLTHKDAYTLLVAVVLSAQCTDKRVNEVTPELFALAGNPSAMAHVPVAKIQGVIRPCGLSPQKARAIAELSRLIVERHGGRVPRTFEELEALPGVGHKTASVVMSQAWGEPAFPVDTHIHRLACRWRLSDGRNVTRTERDLKTVFPRAHWNALHLRIIYYGREHCTARGCDGHTCGICSMLNGGATERRGSRKRVTRVRSGQMGEAGKSRAGGRKGIAAGNGQGEAVELKAVMPSAKQTRCKV
jgi:endonuclease-3